MFRTVNGVELFAPESYWVLTDGCKADICKGMGSKGFGGLVPDTFYWIKMKDAADILDYMYHIAAPSVDAKEEADRVFLNNMTRIINTRSKSKILRKLRLCRAKEYYRGVRDFGGPAFWDKKE